MYFDKVLEKFCLSLQKKNDAAQNVDEIESDSENIEKKYIFGIPYAGLASKD